jgi:hypothetical protein
MNDVFVKIFRSYTTSSPSKDHRDAQRNYMLYIAIFNGIVTGNDIKGDNNNDNRSKN